MKTLVNFILMLPLVALSPACKQRSFNQMSEGTEQIVTLCKREPLPSNSIDKQSQASVRISCLGSCEGDDYSTRKFYIGDSTMVAGVEFEAKYKSGVRLRDLFIFNSQLPVAELLKKIQTGTDETKTALMTYGLDESQIEEIIVPNEQRVLLFPGTRASLTRAGLLDGGTLDCRGQPIDGSQNKNEFKQQNLNQIRRAATLQGPG